MTLKEKCQFYSSKWPLVVLIFCGYRVNTGSTRCQNVKKTNKNSFHKKDNLDNGYRYWWSCPSDSTAANREGTVCPLAVCQRLLQLDLWPIESCSLLRRTRVCLFCNDRRRRVYRRRGERLAKACIQETVEYGGRFLYVLGRHVGWQENQPY